MANIDAYAACPCGSGKKFKWCCQPIHDEIVTAFRLEEEGQHDTATRAMEALVAQHPTNPEAWGRRAQLLYMQQKFEEAEASLQKAFELSPTYPFGHYLQGRFRYEEREIAGALILFRRAAEHYDPSAALILSDIQGLIFDCELKLNHPIAARAALEVAARLNPANDSLRQVLDQINGPESRLPPVARKEYKFQSLPASAPAEKAAAWKRALESAATGKLIDVVAAFKQLTDQDAQEPAACYNLGLSWAWLGDNAAAVEALDRYVALEPDEDKAGQAWALAEVLRCGQGMEDQADTVENIVTFVLRNPEPILKYLEELQRQHRLIGARVSEEEGVLTGLIVEKMGPALTPELAAKQSPHLGASMLLVANILTLRNTHKQALEAVAEEFRQALGASIGDTRQVRGPAHFSDLFSEAMVFPLGVTDQAEAQQRIGAGFERFFEEVWMHRPQKALGGVPPIDAAGHATLKKKLRGIVQLLQESASLNQIPYDFDRLRRKLGLLEGHVQAVGAEGPDIASLGTKELSALDVDGASAEQLEQAYQTAIKQDARELAGTFARTLVQRPASKEKPDRYALYNHLIQLAQSSGKLDEALDHVNAGEKDDCENNEGRRRNDYEVRRGQLLAKRGEVTEAQDTFDRLIARVPGELRYQGTAAESMLSARQSQKALKYAEQGLAGARQQNNRDMEGYFQELVSAAQRGG